MAHFPPKRIVVAVDLSKASLTALSAAKALAKRFSAALEIVFVEDMPPSLAGLAYDGADTKGLAVQTRQFRNWRTERLRRAGRGLAHGKLRIKTIEGWGWPPQAMARLARGPAAGLIVMGTHGYTGFARALMGSTAESVVGRARVPVLTTHEGARRFAPKKVLLPFNLEPYSKHALLLGLETARALGAEATVMLVDESRGWREDALARLRYVLRKLLGSEDAAKLKTVVRRGSPAREVAREAVAGGFGLVVLSAHRRFLSLSSVAQAVVRRCAVPVLSVPVPAPARRATAAASAWSSSDMLY